jgi:hypothetical protein
MATETILHVGQDLSYRIPIMEKAGLSVRRAPYSEEGIRDAFAGTDRFSALTFQLDSSAISTQVVRLARSRWSPLVLFENTVTEYDPLDFDVVIPSLTRPERWLSILHLAIEHSRRLLAYSSQLREEAIAVRAQSRDLRSELHRLLASPIDVDAFWRPSSGSESAPLAFKPGSPQTKKLKY